MRVSASLGLEHMHSVDFRPARRRGGRNAASEHCEQG